MTERADLRSHGPSGILRPGIRTYKPRRTRITERQERALQQQAAFIIPVGTSPIDTIAVWGIDVPVVMEIGFGDGLAAAEMAAADPTTGLLAIDVHTPGVGGLLARVGDASLTNVRVMEAGSLHGVRTYFPDPWPKARHHKRRIVQSEVLDLVHSRLQVGGSWHLATDWAEYADWIQSCFDEHRGWIGGVIERPPWRPVTRYERRALHDGRSITDLVFRTVAAT